MDIVKRLRKQKWQVFDEMRGLIPDTTAYEAADEIERLREALAAVKECIEDKSYIDAEMIIDTALKGDE